MDKSDTAKQVRIGAALARLALVVGLICALGALLAGPGYRLQLLSLGQGLQTIRWAAIGAAIGAGAAVLALGTLLLAPVRRGLLLAAAALLLNALVAGPPLIMYQRAQQLPGIHDISTDTTDPPQFVAVLPLRKSARNSVDYSQQTAQAQKRGYPDIAPLTLEASPAEAFDRAARAARAMGWEIVAAVPADLRIEATDTTLLFGFKDDVVIRVRPTGQGSVVDVRSLSRVGGSDLGVNAKRVRAVLQRIGRP